MTVFNVGDRVIANHDRVIRFYGKEILTVTEVYIDLYGDNYLRVNGKLDGWYHNRFKSAEPTMMQYDPAQQGDTEDDI